MKGYDMYEAHKLFDNTKKTLQIADKVFAKEGTEFMLSGDGQGNYYVTTQEGGNTPICQTQHVLTSIMGQMYFNHFIGKDSDIPAWAMHNNYDSENWEILLRNMGEKESYPFANIEKSLDKGCTVYCSVNENKSQFVLNNNMNENVASNILIQDKYFSSGMEQVDSMASYVMSFENSAEQ